MNMPQLTGSAARKQFLAGRLTAQTVSAFHEKAGPCQELFSIATERRDQSQVTATAER